MSQVQTLDAEQSEFTDVRFRRWKSDDALTICSGLTAVLNSFNCSDTEKENALEYVLKQHRSRSLEKAREKAGV